MFEITVKKQIEGSFPSSSIKDRTIHMEYTASEGDILITDPADDVVCINESDLQEFIKALIAMQSEIRKK